MSFIALTMLFVLLPSVSPSMLVQTDTGDPHSLFNGPFPAVKSFHAIGPDSQYLQEFSSLDQSAPLVYLDPADSKSCPGCCDSFSPSSSLPLSLEVASLVANKTVVMKYTEVSPCAPRVDTVSGFETMHIALDRAGARAVIMITFAYVPGVTSNVIGSFTSPSDRREAKASLVPFVAIGFEAGEKLTKAVQESSVQNSSSHVHVKFTFDDNEFLVLYRSYFELPSKFVSFLVVAFIIHRCYSLGLNLDPTTNLPLLSSTKNLVVLMALPVAAAIMMMISRNGLIFLDENSTGSVFYTASSMLPCLNLSSTVLVGRFWNMHKSPRPLPDGISISSSGVASDDPAKTHPVKTLLIVFVGFSGDLFLGIYSVFAPHDPRPATQIIYVLITICNIVATAYFFYSGVQVLRALSTSDQRLTKTMAYYLLTVAVFTLMINVCALTVATEYYLRSADGFFVNISIFLGGNYGATLCHLFVFTAKKDSGDANADDETFLETENRRLARNIFRQKESIAQLEKENFMIKETAKLETKLLQTSLQQAETNGKLLKAEKASMKQNARAALLSALRDVRKPLNGIVVSLKLIFSDTLQRPGLENELRRIAECAHHQKVLIKSAIDLDTFVTGNKQIRKEVYNPAQVCRDAVALQADNSKNGIDVILTSSLKDEVVVGTPSQLNVVLMNLLSRAAISVRAGTIRLSADVVLDSDKHQVLKFAVSDDGREVPTELQDIFFGTRGQLGNEKEQIRNFGFGAFVAYEFVKRMSHLQGMLLLRSPIFTEVEGGEKEGEEGEGEGEEGEEGEGEGGGGGKRHGARDRGRGSEISFDIRVRKIRNSRKLDETVSSEEEEDDGQEEVKSSSSLPWSFRRSERSKVHVQL